MKTKPIIFTLLISSVLILLACSLSTQKTGKAGDDDLTPLPSPKDFECVCNAKPSEEELSDACYDEAKKFCGSAYDVIGYPSKDIGKCDACVKKGNMCEGSCRYYAACYIECLNGDSSLITTDIELGCKKVPVG